MLAVACRVAVILGIHREPQLDSLDSERRNFQRRLWWTLYSLEVKAAMELGRPLAINLSQVTCCLPSETPQRTFSLSHLTQAPISNFCFSANLQLSKLILAARSVYVTFYGKCAEVLGESKENRLYGNLETLETCAKFLSSKMKFLKTWPRESPDSLKTKRKNGGEPFSMDGSALDIQPTVSFLQQRQQLLLELNYHTLCMDLLRHFINFPQPSHETAPLTEINAITCVDHAITITNIIHQTLTETTLLSGWLESYRWHGNAFLSLIGYLLAYPNGKRRAEARKAIQKAIPTFDILSRSLAMAACSASMARELFAKVELVIHSVHPEPLSPAPQTENLCNSQTGNLLLDPINYSAPSAGDILMVQNSGEPDSLMGDGNEVVSLEGSWWSLELYSSMSYSNEMEWANADASQTGHIWNFTGEDLDENSFNYWFAGDPRHST